MEEYRIIKCEENSHGRKNHQFLLGEIVYRTEGNIFNNGIMHQILHPDEYELIKEETP